MSFIKRGRGEILHDEPEEGVQVIEDAELHEVTFVDHPPHGHGVTEVQEEADEQEED